MGAMLLGLLVFAGDPRSVFAEEIQASPTVPTAAMDTPTLSDRFRTGFQATYIC